MKSKEVLVIPGLGDDIQGTQEQTNHWKKLGLNPIIVSARWNEPVSSFEDDRKQLLKIAKSTAAIVGISAGASLAIQLAYDLDLPYINVCGRLRPGGIASLYPFFAQNSDRFKTSVQNSASLLSVMGTQSLTFGSVITDGIVPYSRIKIDGAENILLPPLPHGLAIKYVLRNYGNKVNNFIDS